jgi:hypothetical protein
MRHRALRLRIWDAGDATPAAQAHLIGQFKGSVRNCQRRGEIRTRGACRARVHIPPPGHAPVSKHENEREVSAQPVKFTQNM